MKLVQFDYDVKFSKEFILKKENYEKEELTEFFKKYDIKY
jgi:hypothetical protein